MAKAPAPAKKKASGKVKKKAPAKLAPTELAKQVAALPPKKAGVFHRAIGKAAEKPKT